VSLQWGSGDFLRVYALLACANFVLTAARAVSFARAGLQAAATLHTRLLVGVVGAAQAFHDTTPSGRLLNRLSGDVFAIDDSLPFSVNILLAQSVGLLGTVVILGISTLGLFLALLPVLCLSFLRLQARYRETSRELKRVDATTRSPLLTQFAELQRGEAIILAASLNRGPGASPADRERARGLALLDASQRSTFASGMAGQWLGLRLQAMGIAVLGILCAFCFCLRLFSLKEAAAAGDDACPAPDAGCAPPAAAQGAPNVGSASVGGLILSLSLPVVYQLQGLLGAFTDTEKEFISVERVLEYAALPPEDGASTAQLAAALAGAAAPAAAQAAAPSPQWQPAHHGLSLDRVSVTYPGCDAPALQLTLEVPPGAKVGVVGRTGSGKSTLLALLWRLVPFSGRAALGGRSLAAAPLAQLRAALSIVPQEPLLLKGSLRFNLDPAGAAPDAALLAACDACGLRAAASELPAGAALLDFAVGEGGRNLSVGQQQLVCLARCLVRGAPALLALDEPASAADAASHALLRAALRSAALRGTTALVVAHNLATVLDLDLVLVLHGGRVAEVGPPAELLARGRALGLGAREDGEGALLLLEQESRRALQ
jgi:ATP-binding cassette subfamily C (CFTR/MRP) protein 10